MAEDTEYSKDPELGSPPSEEETDPGSQSDAPANLDAAPTDPETLKLLQKQRQALSDALSAQDERFQTYGSEQMNTIAGQIQDLKEMESDPSKATGNVPWATPIPKWLDDERERLKLGPIAMDMIKWGAVPSGIISLGFGSGQPVDKLAGAVHMTFWAKALQALQGSHPSQERRLEVRKFAEAWHKNQEYWAERNKAQTQQYHDILDNKKLAFSQKLSLIEREANFLQNYRMMHAAKNANIKEIYQSLFDQARMSIAFEKHLEKNKDDWWKHLGLNAFQYQEWVHRKGGPLFDQEHTPLEQLQKIRKNYPYSQFIAEKTQEEFDREVAKARAKTKASEEERQKAVTKTELENIQKKAAAAEAGREDPEKTLGTQSSPVTGPVTDEQRQSVLKDLEMDRKPVGSGTEDSDTGDSDTGDSDSGD